MRWVCCLDLDTFFVSVERLLDPSLERRPVIVGGRRGGPGVVTACSYEVRAHGVRSGMSMREASLLAPVETVRDVGGGELAEVLRTVRDRAHVIAGRQRVRQFDHVSPAACAPPPHVAAPGTPRHELLDGSTVRRPSAGTGDLGVCGAPNRR